jgi:hypothetical protein
VREVAPKHAAYWHELRLPEYVGGPFADRSGGLISFEAPVEGSASPRAKSDDHPEAGSAQAFR